MSNSNASPANSPLALRLIVIDDEVNWCTALGHMVRAIGHTLDVAHNLEDAKRMICDAEEREAHYAIAIIDRNFKFGEFELLQDAELIDYIKQHHAYMACVVASGEQVLADDVLDLRDNKDLDYYLQKTRISIDKLRKAVDRSVQRSAARQAAASVQPDAHPSTEQPALRAASHEQQPRSLGMTAAPAQVAQLQLEFQQRDQDTWIVWRTSLLGRKETRFTAPYAADELPLIVRALDVLQYPKYPTPLNAAEQRHFSFGAVEQVVLAQLGLWSDNRVAASAPQTVGQALYRGLGAEGQNILKAVRNVSIAQALTTNYVLRFPPNAISLAALPWELLWDQEYNQALLIRGNTIDSCERYVDLDMAIPPPLLAGQQLHALAISPRYGIPDALREVERAARLRSWERLAAEGKLTFGEVSPLTMASLNDYLLAAPTRPDIIHYFGHGTYRDGKGYLIFDDGAGGRDLVSAERVAATIGDVRLVIIHACQSAMVSEDGGLLTGVAPALSVVTGAVVAMQLTVRTDAATRFAHVLYDQLLSRGRSLQESVARGRQVLFTETTDGASWYVPTLYIRSRDSQPIYFTRNLS